MNTGYYVSIVRGKDWRPLAGPYSTEPEARAHVPHFRAMACDLDARAIFDAFGTCRVQQAEPLPQGILTPSQTPEEWARLLKADQFSDRTARLRHIASGPENRTDVQAAKRLLMKRYQKRDLLNWNA